MRNLLILLLFLISQGIFAQKNLQLHICIDSAVFHHPRSGDTALFRLISSNQLANIESLWYPDVSLKARSSYQSDVVNIASEIQIPNINFPSPQKDQYNLYLDVRQTIYDGGKTRLAKELEYINLKTRQLSSLNEIEEVKKAVTNSFYSILLLQERNKILNLTLGQLISNKKLLVASVENGVATGIDVDLIDVEIMQLRQEIKNLKAQKESLTSMLSLLTAMDISTADHFQLTEILPHHGEIQRKELSILDQNLMLLEKSAEMEKNTRRPVAYAFAQAGYGNPGLNMLNDKFDTWYLVGLGVEWKIWDWNQSSRNRTSIKHQSQILSNKRNEFYLNLEKAAINLRNTLEIHESNIQQYEELLVLKEKITHSYEKKLKEGTIKTIDYIGVMNQEKITRLQLSREKILLQNAIAEYNILYGY